MGSYPYINPGLLSYDPEIQRTQSDADASGINDDWIQRQGWNTPSRGVQF